MSDVGGPAPLPFATEADWRRSPDEPEGAAREYLVLRVAAEQYGIDIRSIREIIRPRDPTEVPNAPPFVRGVVAVRGVVMPLIDLGVRLRLAPVRPAPQSRIVVVWIDDQQFALAVDEVKVVARLREDQIEPPPAALGGGEFIHGIGRVDDGLVILLQLENLLRFEVSPGRREVIRGGA